jgi:far upstream element-binding protein
VQMLSTEGVHENDLPLGNASQEYLVIPANSVGKVIGRGGEMIRELQSRSQAKIQIDHTGQSGMPTDQKQVTLTGTHESVVKAKEMVLLLVANPLMDAQQALNMLIDDKIRNGTKWGSGPPYVNLPNQGINMQPPMAAQYGGMPPAAYGMYPQPTAAAAAVSGGGGYPPSMPPSAYGMPPQQQQQQQQQHAPWGAQASPGYPAPSQHHHSAYGGGGGDGRETDVFYAPRQLMGRIIGGKGVTVNDLQRRSGCDIQINQEVAPGQDCEITLKGSRQGIEMAKAMIQEIIDVGPQHPYAGGMDHYGGGMAAPAAQHMGGGGGGGYHGAYANPYYPQQQAQPQPPQRGGFDPGAYGGPGYMPQGDYAPPSMGGGGYGMPYGQAAYAQPPPQAMAPMRQAPPPIAWKAASAPDGQVYYYNERTGETTWDKPPGMP